VRLGCLANRSIVKNNSLSDFPRQLVGNDEIERLLSEADHAELEALICNPSISDELLEELYQHTGPFAPLSDERWLEIVSISSKNERLNTNEDNFDMPDLGHYSIHRAIFNMLEKAPVEREWMWCLYRLLERLDPNHLAHPERLDHVLARWKALMLNDREGKPIQGHYTSLTAPDEFRCMIGALYGSGFADRKTVLFGSANSPDIALRCAY
jgi:hypothetical protein